MTAAIFFADHPGQVEIVWQGWQLETSVGVLAAAAVLAGLAIAVLYWLVSLILDSPRTFLQHRRERRRRAGYRALTRGMVAVAAGDSHEAQRCARRADALLADPPLTLLLSAQAAQLGGDETAAKRFFTAMLDLGGREPVRAGSTRRAMGRGPGDAGASGQAPDHPARARPASPRCDPLRAQPCRTGQRRPGSRAKFGGPGPGVDTGSCRSSSPSRPRAAPGTSHRTCGKGHRTRLADDSPSGSRAGLRRDPRGRAASRQAEELRAACGAEP